MEGDTEHEPEPPIKKSKTQFDETISVSENVEDVIILNHSPSGPHLRSLEPFDPGPAQCPKNENNETASESPMCGNSKTSAKSSSAKQKNKQQRSPKKEVKSGPKKATFTASTASKDVAIIGIKTKSKKPSKPSHLRRNIKDILKRTQLDEVTIAAQKEEAERKHRMALKLQQLRQIQQQQQLLVADNFSQDFENLSTIFSYDPAAATAPVFDCDRHLQSSIDHIANSTHQNEQLKSQSCDVKKVEKKPFVDDHEVLVLSSGDDEEQLPTVYTTDYRSPQPFHDRFSISSWMEQGEAAKEVISLSTSGEDSPGMAITKDDEKPPPNIVDDSDDDCIILSPSQIAAESDKNEINVDALNVPDEQGRVLINVGHPPEDPDIFLAPQLAKVVKPHQIGGIRFLYDSVVESLERFENTKGLGCILAHSMGLGKTLQAVSFCDVFLRHTSAKNVLIIVPINTIQNWMNEFNQWLHPKKKPATNAKLTKYFGRIKRINQLIKNDGDPTGKLLGLKMEDKNQLSASNSDVHQSVIQSIESVVNTSNSPVSPKDSQMTGTLECDNPYSDLLQINMDSCSASPFTPMEESASGHEEFDVENSNSSSKVEPRSFEVYILNETVKTLQAREKIINDWGTNGGVLLIGYEMYRMLANRKLKKSGKRNLIPSTGGIAEEESLNRINLSLVNPGPDLVICDEGHRIKNSGASISLALKSIRTERRVVMTGYPLQNNLMEYWCMVDFVRPNLLGSKTNFSNMFERPIQNGQCSDSTMEDKRLMRYRSHVLHSLLEGFVQRRSHIVLQDALPIKEEWVFLLKMTPIQYKLYRAFMDYLSSMMDSQNTSTNPIKAFAVCCKIWNHPDVLHSVVKKKQGLLDYDLDLDIGDWVNGKVVAKTKVNKKPSGLYNSLPSSFTEFGRDNGHGNTMTLLGKSVALSRIPENQTALSLEWAIPILEGYTPGILENGVKFEVLLKILEQSVAVGDKTLVFSQSLLTLDLMEIFLEQKFSWKKNAEYFRLDGSTTGLEREKLINSFNSVDGVFCFLVSTRAGSLGINLIGANRVVVFDASWNPCHDCQAVCRVYRYGQTKPCQIYRFVTDCTLEKRIYDRQINKRGMSDRVVDEMNPDLPFRSKDVNSFLVLQNDNLERIQETRCELDAETFSDAVLQRVLTSIGDKLTQRPFEHDSLLIDQKSQKLSAAEKRIAHRNYEADKKTSVSQSATGFTYARPSYIKNSTSSSPTSYNSVPYPSQSHSNSRGSYFPHYQTNSSQYPSLFADTAAPYEAVRKGSVTTQYIIIRKDCFLPDPGGGPDIYVPAGERLYVIRTSKGTYLRLGASRLIALRNSPLHVSPEHDLTKEQLNAFIFSFIKVPGQLPYDQLGNFSQNPLRLYDSKHSVYPPTEQPLPPSPNFLQQNQNRLQIKNYHNNSGGDITVQPPDSDGLNPTGSVTKPSATVSADSLFDGIDIDTDNSNSHDKVVRNIIDGLSDIQYPNPYSGINDSNAKESFKNSSANSTLHRLLNNMPNHNHSKLSSDLDALEVIPISNETSSTTTTHSNSPFFPSTTQNKWNADWKASHQNHSQNPVQNLCDLNSSFFNDFTVTVRSPSKQGSSSYRPEYTESSSTTASASHRSNTTSAFDLSSKSNNPKPQSSSTNVGSVNWNHALFGQNALFSGVNHESSSFANGMMGNGNNQYFDRLINSNSYQRIQSSSETNNSSQFPFQSDFERYGQYSTSNTNQLVDTSVNGLLSNSSNNSSTLHSQHFPSVFFDHEN